MVKILANSGHDENNKYRGGKAGDQTGTEWAVIPWYSRPWTCVLRYPVKAVAKDIAYLARRAAENPFIGYDQGQRRTFWEALSQIPDYDPAMISVPCESDCTCGVATIVKAVGLRYGIKALASIEPDYYYSGNMKSGFKALGFEVLTESKYLTSDEYLLMGDILLCESHHACINLDTGKKVRDAEEKTYTLGWNRDNRGWWYADTNKTYLKDTWQLISGYWYYFGSDGYAVVGLQTIEGKRYIFEWDASSPKECALMHTDESGALEPWHVE